MKKLLFIFYLVTLSLANENCGELDSYFRHFDKNIWQSSTIFRDSFPGQSNANDTPTCLYREHPCASAKYALYGMNSSTAIENITITLGPGLHILDEGLPLHNALNVYFFGVVNSTVVECGRNPNYDNCSLLNVHISESTSIYFYGITFQNCQIDVAMIHIEHSQDVVFEQCTFRNNPSSAVHLYQAHSVAFRDCQFVSNTFIAGTNTFVPHCYTEKQDDVFFLNNHPAAGAISIYSYKHTLKLLISNCTFVGNFARNNTDTNLPRALLSFGNGGAMFMRFFESSNSQVCIINTVFANNTAQVNGGAIQLSSAVNNICSGGAISIDYFQNSTLNVLQFINSRFHNNYASTGGALFLLTSVASTEEDHERKAIWFSNCTFLHNMATKDGSVLSLFSATPINELNFPVFIDNCNFSSNIALDVQKTTHTVSGFHIAIQFLNFTVFHNNFGGGVTGIESDIHVHSSLTFHHNFANNGGGLELYGRCLVQLYDGSNLTFYDNSVFGKGGGLYIEYISTDFIFNILNRGCFIQYHSNEDHPPNEWNTTVNFINNTAGVAGAAMYASDMSYCMWFGNDESINDTNISIFADDIEGYQSPFHYNGNIIPGKDVKNANLGTDAFEMDVETEIFNKTTIYSYGESVSFKLSARDEFENFRETVWQVDAPLEKESLGAISSNRTIYSYNVPSQQSLLNITDIEFTFSAFSISSHIKPVVINISVSSCHPGYLYNGDSCECDFTFRQIIRCDETNRYFYVREGLWAHADDDGNLTFKATIPGFIHCNREEKLPGCLFKFDEPDQQCTKGRKGVLCAECQQNYSLTLDLLNCKNDCSDWGASILFVSVCILTVLLTFIALFFDIAIPNELKGFIFFAQVVGVIYNNSPYINRNEGSGNQFLDFIINMFGISLPFPVCFSNFSGAGIAWLGVVPPCLALITTIIYIISAGRIKYLYERKGYGRLHGLNFITLFVYKYFLDTGFTFFSLRRVYDNKNDYFVFSYTGESSKEPIILSMFIIGCIIIVVFAIIAPIVLLVYIYRPQKHLHLANAFTSGIKNYRRYIWYGVWDIWRRLPFVAINLFISVTNISAVVLLHCILVLIVLIVHCVTKPYIKEHINIIETIILFCLFGATVAILDENDIYIQKEASVFFIIFPFIYGFLCTIFIICLKIYKRKHPEFTMTKFMLSKFPKLNTRADDNKNVNNDELEMKESQAHHIDVSTGLREPLLEST